MSIVHSEGLGEFQQDYATPHTSRIATEWLQEHSSDFRHFRWKPKSPDMNIIEHIWDALQRAVEKRSPPPLTPTDLWTALQDSWCQLPPALLQTLVESMPRRVFHFCVLEEVLHDIRQVYQFVWLFSVVLEEFNEIHILRINWLASSQYDFPVRLDLNLHHEDSFYYLTLS
ncbi:hypothetical protein AVEN_63703-1 [Araneus ventricosus]|uniref:Uncharacterized protein n=1 Tax=Araneus ventricosus TaxID=182803 RepID=A0A4Y2BMW0_ARAVE|nr:hypothetical protein AVEN_63703-1 [Araneus ventricosus]